MARYHRIVNSGKTVLLRDASQGDVAAALLEGKGCTLVETEGRGAVSRFPIGEAWGVIRPYRRGGAIRRLLHDTYFFVNRPLREWRIHNRLYERGFPVPEPLGVAWERHGLRYRGSFATKALDAAHLHAYLEPARAHAGGSDPPNADRVLRRVGALIREMHDVGVYHADLQVRNVLVARSASEPPDGDPHVYLIDFDNARQRASVSRIGRARNLLRLRRSFDKNRLPPRCFECVQEGYGPLAVPAWLERLYRAKGRLSDAVSGRD